MNSKIPYFIRTKKKVVATIIICPIIFLVGRFTVGYIIFPGIYGFLICVIFISLLDLALEWVINAKNYPEQVSISSKEYKAAVDKSFDSNNTPEWQLRAAALFVILKDRIYEQVLPITIKVINKHLKKVNKETTNIVWGRLVACSIYLSQGEIAKHYKNDKSQADKFCEMIGKMFCENYGEKPEIFNEYERKNTNMGNAQPLWALGKTVCDALGIKGVVLADEIAFSSFEEIARIQINTTPAILTMSLQEVKEMVRAISLQHPDE